MNVIEFISKRTSNKRISNKNTSYHSRDGEKELFRGMAKTGILPESIARTAAVNYDENDKAELDGWYRFLSDDNEKESA